MACRRGLTQTRSHDHTSTRSHASSARSALLVDPAEINDRHLVRGGDEVAVDSAEHPYHVVLASELRVLALDIARAQVLDCFDLDPIQDRGIQLLAAAEAGADRDPDDHTGLILVGLVSEPDGDG